MNSAGLLLQRASADILRSQSGEVSGRVEGVLRLLKGLANDEIIGNTELPLYDRAVKTISFQDSFGLYMIAVLDKDLNMVPANAIEPPKVPNSRADRDYLQRMKETGTYQITDVIISRSDHRTRNYTIAVPMFRDGAVDGGIYGSIYLDDIEDMLKREKKGEFFLLGKDRTVMVDGKEDYCGKTLKDIYSGMLFGKDELKKVKAGESGGFWTLSTRGVSYISYRSVELTEWTLVYDGSLGIVLPTMLPMLLLKLFFFVMLCYGVARFGRRYLEQQLATASHLLDRVTMMQKELFRTDQGDYEGILELTQQGLTDQLTGLGTRSVFIKRFSQFTEDGHINGMLCFLDLDDLKIINDSYGHEAGDSALIHIADQLKKYEEQYGGIAARYGGDEFVFAMNGISGDDGRRIAEELCRALASELTVGAGEKSIMIHGSVGVVFYPEHGRNLEELISKADLALYNSKNNGKGCRSVYAV